LDINIQEIKWRGKLIAIVYRNTIKAEGVKFLTQSSHTLQLGLIQHKKNKIVKSHIHNQDIKYKVDITEEFLYVEKGKIKLMLFSNNWDKVKNVILNKGDFVLLISGGHGLKVLKNCRMLEIKQGPYPGDKFAKIYKKE